MNANLAYQDVPGEELIGGKLVAMSPATTQHNRIAENLYFLFRTYLKGKRCVPLGDGYDLYLTDEDRFVPDFMVVCDRNKIKTRGVYGPPDLVAEVLSPSTARYDRGRKMEVYARCGVPEYWIISPGDRFVEVYRLKDDRYVLDNLYTCYSEEDLKEMTEEKRAAVVTGFQCHLYDGFTICLDDIFNDLFD